MLVTSKEINKPQDLIGKKVAISGIRMTGHYFDDGLVQEI